MRLDQQRSLIPPARKYAGRTKSELHPHGSSLQKINVRLISLIRQSDLWASW
jgi:hypothetical protein